MVHKILLADDSITIQKVVNLTFTDEGIDVVTVGNGELALKKLREDAFDLVLADIFMPGRNGYEVCEYIKNQPQLSRVPVILLVGAFEPFDRSEASRVRADGHLTKPFESRILVETVKRMLSQVQPRAAAQPLPAATPAASDWSVPPSELTAVPGQDVEPPPYDPYASTMKMTPFVREPEAASEPTMVIGSPFGSTTPEPESQPAPVNDVFQFNLSGPIPMSVPEGEGDYTTKPHQPFGESAPSTSWDVLAVDHVTESTEEPAEAPAAASYSIPEDFGTIESHTYEPEFVSEARDPLLDTFDDVAQATADVDASMDPELVGNAQPEVPSSMNVGAVDGLTTAWDADTIPAAYRSAYEESDERSESTDFEQVVEEDEYSGRTQSYSPAAMQPFDAAEPAAENDIVAAEPSAGADSNRTQAYRFDLPPYQGAESITEPAADHVLEYSEGRAESETESSVESMESLPIEIVDAPEMPETAPPPPKSLPTPNFNFDPTRTQTYEFGLPPFEEAAVGPDAESFDVPATPLEAEPTRTGTDDLVSEPEAVSTAEGPTDVSYADTAPLNLRSVSAYIEQQGLEPEVDETSTPSVEEAFVAEDAVEEPSTSDDTLEEPRESEEPIAAAPSPFDDTLTLEPVEPVAVNGSGEHVEAGDDLLAVPSDVIDEIVRRTVERLSDDVIREIAWEVVPDIAARLIKKHLAEKQ